MLLLEVVAQVTELVPFLCLSPPQQQYLQLLSHELTKHLFWKGAGTGKKLIPLSALPSNSAVLTPSLSSGKADLNPNLPWEVSQYAETSPLFGPSLFCVLLPSPTQWSGT